MLDFGQCELSTNKQSKTDEYQKLNLKFLRLNLLAEKGIHENFEISKETAHEILVEEESPLSNVFFF